MRLLSTSFMVLLMSTLALDYGRTLFLLDAMAAEYSRPRCFGVDNGAVMTSTVFVLWCERHKIQIVYIQPGKPSQNAYLERFNRSFRHALLDANLFRAVGKVSRNRLGFACQLERETTGCGTGHRATNRIQEGVNGRKFH